MVRNVAVSDIPTLTSFIDEERHPYRLALHLMLEAGLRLQETRQLLWSDLYFDLDPKTAIELTPSMTKYNRSRTLPISVPLAETIRFAHDISFLNSKSSNSDFIMLDPRRRRIVSARQIQRRCMTIGLAAFGRPLTPHMLRHTFATRLLKVSSVSLVQMALGHSRLSTTQIYLHPTSDDLQKAIAAL